MKKIKTIMLKTLIEKVLGENWDIHNALKYELDRYNFIVKLLSSKKNYENYNNFIEFCISEYAYNIFEEIYDDDNSSDYDYYDDFKEIVESYNQEEECIKNLIIKIFETLLWGFTYPFRAKETRSTRHFYTEINYQLEKLKNEYLDEAYKDYEYYERERKD